jgi:hypothetical protein
MTQGSWFYHLAPSNNFSSCCGCGDFKSGAQNQNLARWGIFFSAIRRYLIATGQPITHLLRLSGSSQPYAPLPTHTSTPSSFMPL